MGLGLGLTVDRVILQQVCSRFYAADVINVHEITLAGSLQDLPCGKPACACQQNSM